MVSVREAHFSTSDFDIEQWSVRYCANEQDAKALAQTFHLIEQDVSSPIVLKAIDRAREMVECLAPLHMDLETLQAAVVFVFLEEDLISKDQIEQHYQASMLTLVCSAQQMDDIRNLNRSSNALSSSQIDNIRRMLLSMVEDVRAVVIKLAERVCMLREAKFLDEESRVLLARDVSTVYAPLANRLGIGQLKWELEDLAFHYQHPKVYKEIAHLLDEKRVVREEYIRNFVEKSQQQLQEKNIDAEVYGRPKHIASIWKKMHRKNLSFDQLFDVRAVRILTNNIQDCYGALGVVHTMFKPIPGEFDDYIAHPKPNGYQSIHTVVMGEEGKTVEIQIRTATMHADAELGVAAHWKYKEGHVSDKQSGYEDKINWLRKILQWQDDLSENGSLVEEVRSQVFEDRVYVFTPKGEVINLPLGATVLDFAYYIHSHVGHKAIGAKVDGRIVPFHYEINTGERVEVITSKDPNPKRDWLNPNLGYVRTQRARSKILHWFRQQDRDKNYAAGKEILEDELERLNLTLKSVGKVHERFNLNSTEDLLVAIGGGMVRVNQVVSQIQSQLKRQQMTDTDIEKLIEKQTKTTRAPQNQIEVNGVGNLLTQLAGCCQPLPGDPVVGYITKGRGVTVHRNDCEQLHELMQRSPERVVDVVWGEKYAGGYQVSIQVLAQDRSGLLRDLTTLLATEKSNVLKMSSSSNVREQTAMIDVDLELYNLDALSRVLHKLQQIAGVIEVRRR